MEFDAANQFVLTVEGMVAWTPKILKYPGVFLIDCVGLNTMLLMTFIEIPVVSGVTMLLVRMKFWDTTLLVIDAFPVKDAVLRLLR